MSLYDINVSLRIYSIHTPHPPLSSPPLPSSPLILIPSPPLPCPPLTSCMNLDAVLHVMDCFFVDGVKVCVGQLHLSMKQLNSSCVALTGPSVLYSLPLHCVCMCTRMQIISHANTHITNTHANAPPSPPTHTLDHLPSCPDHP